MDSWTCGGIGDKATARASGLLRRCIAFSLALVNWHRHTSLPRFGAGVQEKACGHAAVVVGAWRHPKLRSSSGVPATANAWRTVRWLWIASATNTIRTTSVMVFGNLGSMNTFK
ncbi:uncharacterized protein LOC112270221 [Brachypodium distachyon]|uniref:Uncharacterized protein n=1 Tax=Brachypodium distachyon TaxID=15368 RepID=A0A0Q3JJZ8_BRADI|nr:uncharacterized protein LOC112270221 [Brachypodium distachyon]KQK17915.1 hypothetical protein BRADI_1g37571v3 [Brachypodium distachyon]PNT75734.1 hypothetical protein BRADI_1g37571v3 [Brachypodium distachyon]PNT75735.1 hypothetical protein BRADI_1g37571v3 [Brachypodium distachyon]PNT75736.1 hypothetical protein BRADI_1g37571v3 [Brachypodium distachyon]|eukprot:XP_024313914.1 uncharacterized protein LOC112270221 [Brachypodium distachyon]